MAVGDRDAVCEYFAAALYASAGWPEDFPRRVRAEWDRTDNHLLVDWELPGFGPARPVLTPAGEPGTRPACPGGRRTCHRLDDASHAQPSLLNVDPVDFEDLVAA